MSNLVDYFRENVTLPYDEITLYTDGSTAWKYAELRDELDGLKAEQARLLGAVAVMPGNKVTRSIAEENPMQANQERLSELDTLVEDAEKALESELEKLAGTGVTFHARAMYPFEIELADEEARRVVNAAKGETLSEEEKNTRIIKRMYWNYMVKSIQKIEYPDGKVVEPPFDTEDFMGLEKYLDTGEYARLKVLVNELNTKAAIRDAQSDAGFPGGRSEQAGE